MGRKISSGKGDSQPTYFHSQVIFEAFVLETLQELFDRKIFPLLPSRQDKFPKARARTASFNEQTRLQSVCRPICMKTAHITSHGLCIFGAIAALLRLDSNILRYAALRGLLNTAWSRVQISVKMNAELCQIDPLMKLLGV